MKFILCSFVLLNVLVGQAFACSLPINSFLNSAHQSIFNSEHILIVKVIGFDREETAKIEVIEVLKGDIKTKFISPYELFSILIVENVGLKKDNFNDHKEQKFWKDNIYTVICPSYRVAKLGEVYLLLSNATDQRNFELLENEDDLWLKTVRKTLATGQFERPLAEIIQSPLEKPLPPLKITKCDLIDEFLKQVGSSREVLEKLGRDKENDPSCK